MYWYVEYEEAPNKVDGKTFLVKAPNYDLAALKALRLIGPGKCTFVPLTVEHLIGRFKFWNGVSCFHD